MSDLSFADRHNPKKIDWKLADQYIKAAMAVGIFSFVVNLFVALTSSPYFLLDVFITGGLTFGLYKKNFPAALAFVIYFSLSKLLMVVYAGSVTGLSSSTLIFSAVFLYGLTLGAIGSYKYKTEKRKS